MDPPPPLRNALHTVCFYWQTNTSDTGRMITNRLHFSVNTNSWRENEPIKCSQSFQSESFIFLGFRNMIPGLNKLPAGCVRMFGGLKQGCRNRNGLDITHSNKTYCSESTLSVSDPRTQEVLMVSDLNSMLLTSSHRLLQPHYSTARRPEDTFICPIWVNASWSRLGRASCCQTDLRAATKAGDGGISAAW